MNSKAVFLSTGEDIEFEKWHEKVLDYLSEAKTATFQEITEKFEVEGGNREVLSNILWIMESNNELKSEPLSIPIAGGLVLTKIFKLPK